MIEPSTISGEDGGMEPGVFYARVDELRTLFAERMRVKGRSLAEQVSRARWSLPRSIARQARYLAEAERLMHNPKLARMIDAEQVSRAYADVTAHLRAVDPKRRRRGRMLNMTAVLAANLLAVTGAVIAFLWWQGLI